MYQADAQSLLLAGRWTRWAWHVWTHGGAATPPPDAGAAFHADVLAGCGLGPLVTKALQQVGDARATWMGPLLRDTTAANLIRRSELQPLYASLIATDVRWCLLKGAATMQRFPDVTSLRRMTDIDLLVHADDFRRVGDTLASDGWKRVDDLGPVGSRWACENTWQRRRTILVELDVHRALHHTPIARALTADLLADVEVVNGLPVPSRTTALLHIALHRAKSAWQGHAAELLDARLLSNSLSDDEFEQLVAQARLNGLLNSLSVVLLATHWWLGETPLREQWLLQNLSPTSRDRVARLAMQGAKAMPIQEFWPRFLKIYAGLAYAEGARSEYMAATVAHGAVRTLDRLYPAWSKAMSVIK
jgi:hypothetical protein